MRTRSGLRGLVVAVAAAAGGASAVAGGPEPSAAERGREALTARGYLRPAWKADAFIRRYGLNPAPYPNDGLPMGLRRGVRHDGTRAGIQVDCLMCHGGSIGGTTYIGLGNTRLDATRLFDELTRANGLRMPPVLFVINSARGTVNAGMFSAVLLSHRNTDLSPRLFPLPMGANMPEMDTPPWWNLAKKQTMYYDGRTPPTTSGPTCSSSWARSRSTS